MPDASPSSAADPTEFLSLWVDPTLPIGREWEVHRIVFGAEGAAWESLGLQHLDPAKLGGPPATELRFDVRPGWSGTPGEPGTRLPAPIEQLRANPANRAAEERTLSAKLPFALAMVLHRLSPSQRTACVRRAEAAFGAWLATGDLISDRRGPDRVTTVGEVPRKILATAFWASERDLPTATLLVPADDLDLITQADFDALYDTARNRGEPLALEWGAPVWGRDAAGGPVLELGREIGSAVRVSVHGVSTLDEACRLLWSARASPRWTLGLAVVGLVVVVAWALTSAPEPETNAASKLESVLSARYPGCAVLISGVVTELSDGTATPRYYAPDGISVYVGGEPCPAAAKNIYLDTKGGLGARDVEMLLIGRAASCAARCSPTR